MKRLFLCTLAQAALFGVAALPGYAAAADAVSGVSANSASATAVASRVYSDDIPALLAGVWQGADRLLLFGKNAEDGEFALVLREFYGWYADRVAEPAYYTEYATRPRNDATVTPAERITVRYATIAENASHTAGAYELSVLYGGTKTPLYIPLAVIDGKLYLDFLVKGSAEEDDLAANGGAVASGTTDAGAVLASSALPATGADAGSEVALGEGFWRDYGAARAISVSAPGYDKELTGYYVKNGAFYHIRYWQTEMPFTYEKAGFTDGAQSFSVDKYIQTAGGVYTCCTGRRTQIRNSTKSVELGKSYTLDADGIICAFGPAYLARMDASGEQSDAQTLLATVNTLNARRAPAPKPPFPPTFPNVRWPNYDELDLYNPSTWNRRNIDIGK